MKCFLVFVCLFLASLHLSAQELLIFGTNDSPFGGRKHDVFLGVLNASDMDSNSIWNSFSLYGSSMIITSIWSSYGSYGSNYSDYSPFNPYAQHPPVVVDRKGNFYGYLTVNPYNKQCKHPVAQIIYKYYETIREDVSKAYKAIFE